MLVYGFLQLFILLHIHLTIEHGVAMFINEVESITMDKQ
jgi:hypothetical protein